MTTGARRRRELATRARVNRIAAAMHEQLSHDGIDADYYWELIGCTRFFRLFVVSNFSERSYTARQVVVERAAKLASSDDVRYVTTIFTFTPAEYEKLV